MKYIYKYVQNNKIVYIGKTSRPLHLRIHEHTRAADILCNVKADVFYAECQSEAEMHCIENLLIDKYRPQYNKRDFSKSEIKANINFKEPDWRPYSDYINPRNMSLFDIYEKSDNILYGIYDDTKIKITFCRCTGEESKLVNSEKYAYFVCENCGKMIENSIYFKK